MPAAWVVLHPDERADVRLAYLDAAGRPRQVLPPVRLEARGAATVWRQAREAAELVQSLASAMVGAAWGAPASECEVRFGRIVHPQSRRSIRLCVWLEVT